MRGIYRKPFNTCWNPAAAEAAAGPQILIWSLGRVVCCCSLFFSFKEGKSFEGQQQTIK
jgi:hypothetical protein